MSVNSSSNSTTDGPLYHFLTNCYESRMTIVNMMSMLIVGILVFLPLLLIVVYLGLQRWMQQRAAASSPAAMSHLDFFTHNMVAVELMNLLACGFYCLGNDRYGRGLQWAGRSIFSLTIPGQTFFHILTCVDRYLAVVHPVTYLGLKQASGVKIRNISTGCVWLLCCSLVGLTQMVSNVLLVVAYFGILVFFLVIVCFCTFSILRVLKHPGPGEVGGDRDRADQSKQRAFHTVVAILVALMFRLLGVTVCCLMFTSTPLTDTNCAVGSFAAWLITPGCLVLPLLFLQRAGKVPGCSKRT